MSFNIHQPIATILNFFGLKGEVRLKPLSRYFEDHITSKDFMIGDSNLTLKEITLDKIKGVGKRRIFKFRGVDSLAEAESLKGKTLFIKVSEYDKINLISRDLIGWDMITDLNKNIGKLIDVMWLPGNDVYIIKNGEKEYLIPIIDEIIKKLDYERKQIIIHTIDGLLY